MRIDQFKFHYSKNMLIATSLMHLQVDVKKHFYDYV